MEDVDDMNVVCVLVFGDGCSTVVMLNVGDPLGLVLPPIGVVNSNNINVYCSNSNNSNNSKNKNNNNINDTILINIITT